uniref:CCHC-type domain-containing protein n=1 Tax=Tanacetum cinerariifolium TaxID=118510 RepID=A0A6L2NHN2_TANCI|nr:hypothetical protein [Tanacetum cinerariifolium]
MLEKSMYDSWTSRICLFIKGKKHDRMMLDLIDNGPLVYPTVKENRKTRPKKHFKLTEAQQLQDECDVQVTNINLYGLPSDMYALVNHQKAAKDIWDIVKMLMKGTELSYQERECRLYNLFDKFAHVLGETVYEYYWRFSQLINDMHTIGMTMQQVQVKTNQHEQHANEVRISHERYQDSLAFVANTPTLYNPSQSPQHLGYLMYPPPQQFPLVYAAPIHHQHYHTPVNPQQHLVSPPPFISSSMTQQSQAKFPQLDSGLAVPMFHQGEDSIECINKAMAFLSAVASRRIATTSNGNVAVSPPGVVKCYNCQREGHMVGQCTQPKRPRNAVWFKKKLMLAEAQEAGQILDEEQLALLADPDCDDLSSAKANLVANLSSCDPEFLYEVVQIVLWDLDSECSKHMTGNRSQLMNFVSKILGTIRFEIDQVAKIIGAPETTNLYTISLDNMLKTSPICLLSKDSKTKSWLWHRRLSHLNFGTLNKLAKYGLARGPTLQVLTPATSSSGLVSNIIPQQPCNPLKRDDWDTLSQLLFDEYFNPLTITVFTVPVVAAPSAIEIADSPVSTSIDQDAPSSSIPSTQDQEHSLIISQCVEESPKTPLFHDDPLHEFLHENLTFQGSSSNVRPSHTPFELIGRWTKDHLIANVISDPSRSVSTKNTPMVEKNNLDEDLQGTPVDATLYRGMIGSLMYLISIKRIFRYLKGTINMGLWYSKDTDMSLTAYLDADHARCQDTRRSTSGSAQFLEYQLADIFTKPLPRERFNFLIEKLAEEAEAVRKVHAAHARIVTESVLESAKKKSGGRSSKSVIIQDTPSTPKSKPTTLKTKLKGALSLTPQEQEAANVMQLGGDEQDSEFSDDDNDDVEKDDKNGHADDEGDDHVSDTQDADDENVKTESDEDEIYKYKIRVRNEDDVEMKDAEVELLVRPMRECNQDPLALVSNHQMTPSHFNTYQSSYNNPQFQQKLSPSQDKVLLVEAQGSGKVLNEEELEFLANLGVAEGSVTVTVITHNAAYQANDLDAYDCNWDDFSTSKAVLMANLSSYGSDVLSEVVQIVLWYLDSGCSKHMTGDRFQLTNFVHKFFGTVKFDNDQIANIISEDLGELQAKADIGPRLQSMTRATSSSGLVSNPILQQPCDPPPRDDWYRLFQPMFDEYFNPPTIVVSPVPVANAPRVVDLADSRVSTSIDQDSPSTNIPSTQEQEHSPIISQDFKEPPKIPHFHDDPLHESLHEDSIS